MAKALVNLYIQDKLKEEHYIARLNDVVEGHGYIIAANGWLTIQDHLERQYANLTYRGTDKRFMVQTTSSTYTVHQASNYIQELQEAINLAEYLNEAIGHIEEEIYNRYLDEYPNNEE